MVLRNMSKTSAGGTGVAKYAPDDLDRQIIAHLRADGRASLSKLSDALGVARGTVQNRLERLLETGTLLGFTVRVREDYDVNTVHAVMMIEVVGKSTTQVIRKLRGMPEIYTLHTTNGNWDLVANIRAANLSEFDRILREVRMIDGVANSETSLLLSSV
jgi:DNA-binding Lrp family transcriptional regulator